MVPWQQCVVCPSTFLMNRRHALRISLLLYLIKKLEKVQGERLKRYFKWVAIGMGNGQMKKCLWTRSKVGYQGHFRYTLRVVIAIKPMPWAKRASLYNHNRYSYCIWIFWPNNLAQQFGPILAQLGLQFVQVLTPFVGNFSIVWNGNVRKAFLDVRSTLHIGSLGYLVMNSVMNLVIH